MRYIWLSPSFINRYSVWYRDQSDRGNASESLGEMFQYIVEYPEGIESLPLYTTSSTSQGTEWKVALLRSANIVMMFDFRHNFGAKEEDVPEKEIRSILIQDELVSEWLGNHSKWISYCKGLSDIGLLDSIKKKDGNWKEIGKVSSIFLPGKLQRLNIVDYPSKNYCVILSECSSLDWGSHAAAMQKVKQPTGNQVSSWEKVYQALEFQYKNKITTFKWTPTANASDASETAQDNWISQIQLNEIGIVDQEQVRAIAECRSEDDFVSLIETLSEKQWEAVEALWQHYLLQQRRISDGSIGPIVRYELNRSNYVRSDETSDYNGWLKLLTPQQKAVVTNSTGNPIRLTGGPGTGKTLTAVLRAAWLLKQSADADQQLKVGFFVFNRDLGQRIYDQCIALGIEDYFGEDSKQKLVVTSLAEWCEEFLKLKERGVEPLAPYRVDTIEEKRKRYFDLAIRTARETLIGAEYEDLWTEFDVRSRNGVREIETEISQFIKAYGIRTRDAYLHERRETLWLRKSERNFRKFVWEVYEIYDNILRLNKLIDADDLVNDCFRQVSQSIWQNYEKTEQGFDYLIVDEAHDFFRHQLYLLSAITKNDRNLMMCFDEGQMVYSRYPTLREMGRDSGVRFNPKRLEVNFRNSKQILAALAALTAAFPVYDYNSLWGSFGENAKSQDGPKPIAQGFQSDTFMKNAIAAAVRRHLENGVDPQEIAIIGFDDEQVRQLELSLRRDQGLRVCLLTGAGRRPPRSHITITSARNVKGSQYDVCILVGTDRNSLPDLAGAHSEIWAKQKTEEDFRLFVVAVSRCRLYLHFLWVGTRPSVFIEKMGSTVQFQG